MKQISARFQEFVRDEQGATATEYSIMIVLIVLVCIAIVAILGQRVDNAFDRFVDLFSAH